jgi:hypothetical protein
MCRVPGDDPGQRKVQRASKSLWEEWTINGLQRQAKDLGRTGGMDAWHVTMAAKSGRYLGQQRE